jgi:phage recombination protein Bet
MGNEIARTTGEMTLSADQVELVKRTICKGATDDELALFVQQCKRTGLDPFSKQIHAVKRWDAKAQREVMSIQVGIDGFRLVAERTREADGQEGPFWCGADGVWKDVWLAKEHPEAARVLVYRKGQSHPYVGVARYGAYVQTKKDGAPNTFWARMPDVMLAKAAEALALRKAFPQELSGLYAPEEMGDEQHAEHVPHGNGHAAPHTVPSVRSIPSESKPAAPAATGKPQTLHINAEQWGFLKNTLTRNQLSQAKCLAHYALTSPREFPSDHYDDALRKAQNNYAAWRLDQVPDVPAEREPGVEDEEEVPISG